MGYKARGIALDRRPLGWGRLVRRSDDVIWKLPSPLRAAAMPPIVTDVDIQCRNVRSFAAERQKGTAEACNAIWII